jgi:hypothetical protein
MALLLIIALASIKYLDYENEDSWKSTKEELTSFSFNLFINKFYLSNNHIKFNVNTSNFENNDINNSCMHNTSDILSIGTNEITYLPLSKKGKLYFKKEDNITCVYAVDKDYKLLDIGYINP